eukprot:GFYU01006417.1.p1 GENE.GFYU01006417.1~~GFYU01006417.1.p1  ORF type:complete len:384 (-),score=53.97 GFYU01006417.1:442-1593(-)
MHVSLTDNELHPSSSKPLHLTDLNVSAPHDHPVRGALGKQHKSTLRSSPMFSFGQASKGHKYGHTHYAHLPSARDLFSEPEVVKTPVTSRHVSHQNISSPTPHNPNPDGRVFHTRRIAGTKLMRLAGSPRSPLPIPSSPQKIQKQATKIRFEEQQDLNTSAAKTIHAQIQRAQSAPRLRVNSDFVLEDPPERDVMTPEPQSDMPFKRNLTVSTGEKSLKPKRQNMPFSPKQISAMYAPVSVNRPVSPYSAQGSLSQVYTRNHCSSPVFRQEHVFKESDLNWSQYWSGEQDAIDEAIEAVTPGANGPAYDREFSVAAVMTSPQILQSPFTSRVASKRKVVHHGIAHGHRIAPDKYRLPSTIGNQIESTLRSSPSFSFSRSSREV